MRELMTKSAQKNNIAFIIGNGLSRNEFNLEVLMGKGTIYGCNALYRDFMPDFLVAIDDPIIEEINESDFPKDRFIVPPDDDQLESALYHKGGYRPRSNAGTNAILEAIKQGHYKLICLGFDFLIAHMQFSTANIYDKSTCYEAKTRASYMDNLNRAKYLEWVCNQNRNVQFVMVYPRQKFTVHSIKAPNIQGCY